MSGGRFELMILSPHVEAKSHEPTSKKALCRATGNEVGLGNLRILPPHL